MIAGWLAQGWIDQNPDGFLVLWGILTLVAVILVVQSTPRRWK